MNYLKLYEDFINQRKFRIVWAAYIERHHIVPKSLGGNDDDDNIVLLSAGEHLIAHFYLWKIHSNNGKMNFAFMMMCNSRKRFVDDALLEEYATEYQKSREEFILKQIGRIIPEETRRKISESNKISQLNRPPIKDETRKKLSIAGKGRIVSNETCEKISKALKESEKFQEYNSNRPEFTDETKQNISKALIGKPKSEEHRKNLSIANMGKSPPNKGIPHSEETKKILSIKNTGKVLSQETKDKISKTLTGIKRTNKKRSPCSEETKKKISDAQKGKPRFVSDATREILKQAAQKRKGQRHSDETKNKISADKFGAVLRINPLSGKKEMYHPNEEDLYKLFIIKKQYVNLLLCLLIIIENDKYFIFDNPCTEGQWITLKNTGIKRRKNNLGETESYYPGCDKTIIEIIEEIFK